LTIPRDRPVADATPDVPVADATPDLAVGVGPHPRPWPEDPRLDPDLLAHGDRRNVVDRYRYWGVPAIVADLDTRRHEFVVAIENWQHDAFFRLFRPVGTPACPVPVECPSWAGV
jgi:hypothetical protein